MSEMYMFKEKVVNDSTYQAKFSQAIGHVSIEDYDDKKLNKYARSEDPPDKGNSYQGGSGGAIGTSPILMFDKFSVSGSFGLPPGVDATTEIGNDYYVTGNAGISYNQRFQGQVILQKRILDGNPIGLSLGGVFKKEEISVEKNIGRQNWDDGYPPSMFQGTGPEEIYSSYMIGIRGLTMLSLPTSYGTSRPFLYITGSYNYDLKIDMWYPKVGFAIGFY
jgi:hypothetical protein